MPKKGMVTITKKEYEELKEYKQAFIDIMQLYKKAGAAYEKYKKYKEIDQYLTKTYPYYAGMKRNFEEKKKWGG